MARGHQHTHSHGHPEAGGRRVAAALAVISSFMLVEVVFAVVGHSLALLADAGHLLTDVAALAASLVALRLSRRPASGSLTFGLRRAEVLSAQANGITLLVAAALVVVEAVRRLVHPGAVSGGLLVGVAAGGVAANLIAARLLAGAGGSLAVEGSVAHVVTDLYAFLGTVIAGVVVLVTGFTRADAIASLVVVGLMLYAAAGLLSTTGRILLEAAPEGVEPAAVAAALRETPGVDSVHDMHVWLVSSGFPALSAHVLVRPPADCHDVRRRLETAMREQFGLDHTTLQVDHAADELLTISPPAPQAG